MKLKMFAMGVIAIALTACSSGSDDDVTSLDVITVSGVTMSLDGTWIRSCAGAPVQDQLLTMIFSGTSLIVKDDTYASNNGSCSGGITSDVVYNATFTTGSVMAITGWLDLGGTAVAPPLAQDGSGSLSNTESVTSLTVTVNLVTPANPSIPPGTEMQKFFVVDDTVAGAPVMYQTTDSDKQKADNVPLVRQ